MDYLTIVILAMFGLPIVKRTFTEIAKGKNIIAKVPFYGPIKNLPSSHSFTTPDGLYKNLSYIRKDRRIKGLVFDINSPGGDANASQQVYEIIKEIKLPKVALVNGVCASGAYMAACACDEIVATEFSLIGSIGAIMKKYVFSDFMAKHGLSVEIIKSGKNKDFFSSHRNFSEDEVKMLTELVDNLHSKFVDLVYTSRQGKIKLNKLQEFATGKITDSDSAKRLGLIDYIGSNDVAVNCCETLGGFKASYVQPLIERKSLFSKLSSSLGYNIGKSLAEKVSEIYYDNIKLN